MSLVTPTTAELSDGIVAQLESSLEQTLPLFPKAFLRVIAKVLAAAIVLVYRYAGFSLLQQFVAHATMDETVINGKTIRPLVEHGRERGVGDPLDGSRAELVVRVTVLSQVGDLLAGTQLLRPATAVLYQVTADRALDAATVDVTVRASSDPSGGGGVGIIGNLEDGDILEFASTPPNVGTEAVVQSPAVTGTDPEEAEAYRGRILGREQAKPQGGAYADYRAWAEEAFGVANVYPYKGSPGEMDVYIEATSDVPDGIPGPTILAAAKAAIELTVDGLASRRPGNALANTLPISREPFTVEVASLVAPGETREAVQTAIAAGVDEFLRSREPFILGLSVLPRLDRVTQGDIGGVVSEIASAAGATVSNVTLKLATTIITARTLGTGEKAKLAGGEITWV